MNEKKSPQFPNTILGHKLKHLREKNQQTLGEVSGAVEIEVDALLKIERGQKLPSEDILLLLISHFDLDKDEAMKLWQLAGYDNRSDNQPGNIIDGQPTVIVVPFDGRVIYTDLVHITTNNYGITMNFMQNNTTKDGMPLSVARVGMSREHAKSVVDLLNQVLSSSMDQTKLLDQTISKSKKKKDNM